MSQEYFTVEKLLKHFMADDKKIYILVKWEGYSSDQCTWEPVGNLLKNCASLVRQYFVNQNLLPIAELIIINENGDIVDENGEIVDEEHGEEHGEPESTDDNIREKNTIFSDSVAESEKNADMHEDNVGNDIQENNVGNDIQANNVGNDIQENNVGNDVQDNNVGSDVQDNNIGSDIQENSVGSGVQENVRNDVQENSVGSDIKNNDDDDNHDTAIDNHVVLDNVATTVEQQQPVIVEQQQPVEQPLTTIVPKKQFTYVPPKKIDNCRKAGLSHRVLVNSVVRKLPSGQSVFVARCERYGCTETVFDHDELCEEDQIAMDAIGYLAWLNRSGVGVVVV